MDSNMKVPVYIQIKNDILSDIRSGKYPEEAPLPAVNVIAQKAGVSVRTAYLAVQELIKDGVCFKRPKKGTYVGNPANLVKHPVCAVWTEYDAESPFEHPLSSIFYFGLLQGSAACNITPVLVSDDPENVIKRYERSKEFNFMGVIVLDVKKFDAAVELAKKFPDKKFFFLNYAVKNINQLPPNMTAIVNDNYVGAYKMAEHIVASKCRDVLLLSTKLHDDDNTYRNRIKGALAAFKDYSVDIPPENVVELEPSGQGKNAFLFTIKRLRAGNCPRTIFCVNDLLAEGVAQALAEEKVDDVMITGYDYLYPFISQKWKFATVKVPYTKMVTEALRLLCCEEPLRDTVIKLRPEMKLY